ncbi:hypothetical protein ABZ208_26780 [Streptomyces sp. NPDC006208]|uniref:hypothetical protein n=1 Tax=Streptomyces sp. NPDC006208 TaxID=3156734 RepID=UPI0033A19039
MTAVRRLSALVPPALLAALAGAAPAAAADQPDRARVIAERLAEDPVYVDAESAGQLAASVQQRMRRQIRDSKVPVFVVVARSNYDSRDPYEGDPEILLSFVHDRLRRDGVYVAASEDGDQPVSQEYGVDRDAATAELLGEYDEPLDVSLPRFVDAVVSGTAEEQYDEENGSTDDEDEDDRKNTMSGRTALGIVVTIVVVFGGLALYRLRKGSGFRA